MLTQGLTVGSNFIMNAAYFQRQANDAAAFCIAMNSTFTTLLECHRETKRAD